MIYKYQFFGTGGMPTGPLEYGNILEILTLFRRTKNYFWIHIYYEQQPEYILELNTAQVDALLQEQRILHETSIS